MIHTQIDLPTDEYKEVERIAKASKKEPNQVLRDLITQGLQGEPSARSGGKLPVENHFGTMPGLWTKRGQDAAEYGRQLRNSMQPRP